MAPGTLVDSTAPQLETAVVLDATTDLLIIDDAAVAEALAEAAEVERASLLDGLEAAAVLRARRGAERTLRDIHLLEGLILQHEAFGSLECSMRMKVCQAMELVNFK